ncbi:MAG: peptidase domain-containing ABC transporter [Cyanobacteria bacterium SID2]|nr:peptidase domain-containing ABC transporter [Cyanobacteria bacterium SID2]
MKVVRQQTETDCGAACLGTVAAHYGLNLSLNPLREAVGTGQQGTTLLGLQRGAQALGFNARSVRANPEVLDRLEEVPLPAILHWNGYHWVVFFGRHRRRYVIGDPGVGLRYLSHEELQQGWQNWVMLLLEPDAEGFATQLASQPQDKAVWWKRLWRPIWQRRGLLWQVLLFNLTIGLLSMAMPFFIQFLTDDVLVRGDSRLLDIIVLVVVTVTVFSNILTFVQATLTAHFSQRLELGLILEFGRKLLHLPLQYYDTHRSGEVMSRLQDIQQVNQFVSALAVSLPAQVFIAVISFSLMLFYNTKLAVIAIFSIILMSLSTIVFLPILQQKTRNLLVLEAETQGVLVETFKGALTLKTTTAQPQFWEEVQSRFGRLANLEFRTTQIVAANGAFSSLVSGIAGVALLWFGSTLVIDGQLTIGQLLAFSTLHRNVASFVGVLLGFADEYARVKTAIERLMEVVDRSSEGTDKPVLPDVEITPESSIVCDNVSFHYPGQIDVLDRLSVKLPGGCVIAIVGESGCGKSTLAKLISGLYPLAEGNIQIGAYNITDLDLACLRRQVVLVPQDAHFWSRSILENFRLGDPTLSFESIVKACQITGADEFIGRLPDKYQTVLGEFGANLSGGQRQRLALARALTRNPPILILDESTSGLDSRGESELFDRLLQFRQGKTTVLISHRPSVVKRADWVVKIDRGRVVAEGTLEQLENPSNFDLNRCSL